MDSRDILIIGAVAVAAFLYWRSRNTTTVSLPAGPAGPGVGAMTSSAANTTNGPGMAPANTSQVGPPMTGTFSGFSAVNMGPTRFANATALGVITDAISPTPPSRPPIQSNPTTVGGAGVFGAGANTMGPQPKLTNVFPILRY